MSSVPITKNIIGVDEEPIRSLIRLRRFYDTLALEVKAVKLTEDELRRLYRNIPDCVREISQREDVYLLCEDLFVQGVKLNKAQFYMIGFKVKYKGERL